MKKYCLILACLLLTTSKFTQMKAQNPDYAKLVEYAVKAPSDHNTQPWLFKIEENYIRIIPDLSKSLPVVDSDDRELYISIGCAVENLCIAASNMGYEANTLTDEKGIITIHLTKSGSITADSLFKQIEKRQTNRNMYIGVAIPDSIIERLKDFKKINTNIYFWQKGSTQFDSLKQYVIEGNSIQMNDKAFKEELKSWMRFNKGQSESKKDGLSYAVFGAPNLPAFISKPIISSFLNGNKQNKGDIKKINSSSHFVLFTTKENTIHQWINTGRTLQRFLLAATREGIAVAHMNQPCEVKELSSKIQENLPINGEYPMILLRVGYADPAPYSKRRNIEEVIIE